MEIKYTNSYIVDHKNKNILQCKRDTEDYNVYVTDLLENISSNKSSAYYEEKLDCTQVLTCCKKILDEVTKEEKKQELEKNSSKNKMDTYSKIIAQRFLDAEIKGQKIAKRFNNEIKVGRLVLVLVSRFDDYQFLIAKTDSLEILTDGDSKKAKGVEKNNKKLGKSCLINLKLVENEIIIDKIRVLLDNSAKYFVDDFMEINPIYKDDYNTKTMITSVLSAIDNSFKKKYPRERLLLKSTFNHYIGTHDMVDYGKIVEVVFDNYFNQEDIVIDAKTQDKFLEKINKLPDTQKFSRQFTIDQKAVPKDKVQTIYKLNEDIGLMLSQKVDTKIIKEKIVSGQEKSGETYIKIYTNEEDTLRTFEKK